VHEVEIGEELAYAQVGCHAHRHLDSDRQVQLISAGRTENWRIGAGLLRPSVSNLILLINRILASVVPTGPSRDLRKSPAVVSEDHAVDCRAPRRTGRGAPVTGLLTERRILVTDAASGIGAAAV
jgi:hypothetical protein